MIAMLDEHCLHDEQIVVQAQYGVNQGNEYDAVCPTTEGGMDISSLYRCHEHEELREHTCEWRNTTQ